ncbi:hypothetical protein BDW67DRAFT_181098 [Aspergillus spinulosporus]
MRRSYRGPIKIAAEDEAAKKEVLHNTGVQGAPAQSEKASRALEGPRGLHRVWEAAPAEPAWKVGPNTRVLYSAYCWTRVTRGEESACTGHLGRERSTSSGSRESRRPSLPPRLGKCHAACQCHSGQGEDEDEDAGARNEWDAAISQVRVGEEKVKLES